MITVIKSPENIDDIHTPRNTVIFLAGSIEMGKAELWQDKFIEKLKGEIHLESEPGVGTTFTVVIPNHLHTTKEVEI